MEKEFKGTKVNGFVMLLILLIGIGAIVAFLVSASNEKAIFCGIISTILGFLVTLFLKGFIMIEPNETRVVLFFGKYKGTIKDNGYFWINPFCTVIKLTERARNLDVEPIKVNDKSGNPVMIGLVLVWKIKDSYKALFEIDSSSRVDSAKYTSLSNRMASFQDFVAIQSDSALRNIASEYSYDNNEWNEEVTLRSGGAEIADRLEGELNNRLSIAGIEVVEARINYLAYAPEIAAVMLRRQQASAIIAAREKIVEGAVGMVHLALKKLEEDNIVDLDDDKKAAMVSNLLVVLCSDEQTQPIINTGTLNH